MEKIIVFFGQKYHEIGTFRFWCMVEFLEPIKKALKSGGKLSTSKTYMASRILVFGGFFQSKITMAIGFE